MKKTILIVALGSIWSIIGGLVVAALTGDFRWFLLIPLAPATMVTLMVIDLYKN